LFCPRVEKQTLIIWSDAIKILGELFFIRGAGRCNRFWKQQVSGLGRQSNGLLEGLSFFLLILIIIAAVNFLQITSNFSDYRGC